MENIMISFGRHIEFIFGYLSKHTWHSARNMNGIFGVFAPTSSG